MKRIAIYVAAWTVLIGIAILLFRCGPVSVAAAEQRQNVDRQQCMAVCVYAMFYEPQLQPLCPQAWDSEHWREKSDCMRQFCEAYCG